MAKKRVAAPAKVRETVLKEYNHRCAVCGANQPHIHHIDEDPSNNDPENLLPLCPNCHLSDQHNPTVSVGPVLLALFRKHKDPTILLPQFLPLYSRVTFLLDVEPGDGPTDDLEAQVRELIGFVAALEMGDFYAGKMRQLLNKHRGAYITVLGDLASEARTREAHRINRSKYRDQLCANVGEVIATVVELLRFQSWRAQGE